ncbi:pLS20_p028 family conjugation system transmembrane protein [Listeria seeligeri]|uniref:pLS20_p028 family conjugation system transmembrane protein n=1 Tax=Listeria seeligeri TaxID=1640 RepID=UPI0022EA6CC5|nr:hypothetical protein [Listeria seeligeri]
MRLKLHKWRPKLLIIGTLGMIVWVVLIGDQIQANANWFGLFEETNEEAKDILLLYDDYLVQGNVILFILRWLAWMLILLLERGVTLFSQANLDILGLGNFAESSGFSSIMNKMDSLEYFFLLMAILLLFFMMLMGKKVEFSQAMGNLMISMIIVLALPVFVSTMLGLATDVGTGLSKGDGDLNIGQQTVIDNTADLTVFAENNWIDPEKIEKKNELTNIKDVRITQQITKPEEFGGSGVLGYNLDFVDGQEVAASFDPDVGFGKRWAQDLIGEGYYRWHVNFITTLVILAALNIAYILSGIRMGRMMIELAFNQGFATYLAFADFRTMTRLKQVLFNIVGILCVIVAIFSVFSVFSAFSTYIVKSGLTGIPYALALIGAIWFVIDGPTIIQKVLGVDAGVSSAWGMVGGALGVKAVSGAGNIATAATALAAQGAAYAGGAVAGGLSNVAEGLSDGLNKKKDEEEPENDDDGVDNGKGLSESNEADDNQNTLDNPSDSTEDNETDGLEGEDGEESDVPDSSDDASEGLSQQNDSDDQHDQDNISNENDESAKDDSKGLNESKDKGAKESNDKGKSELGSETTKEQGTISDKEQKESGKNLDDNTLSESGIETLSKDDSTDSHGKTNSTNNQTTSNQATNSTSSKPTLSGQLQNKVANSKVGKAAKSGYKLTRKPKEGEDE